MGYFKYIGFILLSLMVVSCSSGVGQGEVAGSSAASGETSVTVNVSGPASSGGAEGAPQRLPASIVKVRFYITGPGMAPIERVVDVAGQSSVSETFLIPNGLNRCINIKAIDDSLQVVYTGTNCFALTGGDAPVTVTIVMDPLCDLYVNINTGDDDANVGSPAMPFETITKAIDEAGIREIDNARICVAAGTYYSSGGYGYAPRRAGSSPGRAVGPGNESFPLDLDSGMAVFCTGPGFSTVIDAYDSWAPAFVGAPGTMIDGCRILVDDYGDGIYSEDAIMVNNCLIEGGGNWADEGIVLYDSGANGSAIRNSAIRNINGGGETAAIYVYNAGVTIEDNLIEYNDSGGIYVEDGTSMIRGNTIRNNAYGAIGIDGGVSTITENDIYDNEAGIGIWEATVIATYNSIYCNTNSDLDINSSIQVDARNNAWDHDAGTTPPGPIVDSSGFCAAGTDICYWGGGYGGPPPLYTPFRPAVPGGCVALPPM